MSVLDLYIPTDTTAIPRYQLGDRFYETSFLDPARELPWSTIIRIYPSILTSRPLLVKTSTNGWILLDTRGNNLNVVGSSPRLDVTSAIPTGMIELKVPRPNTTEVLSSSLPSFDENVKQVIRNSIQNRTRLTSIYSINEGPYRAVQLELPTLEERSPPQSPRIRSAPQSSQREPLIQSSSPPQLPRISSYELTDALSQQSYETLVKQLYDIPVVLPEFLIVNDLKLGFIPFSQLSTININNYIIEPLLQPWAGPPSTQNRILTIFASNGMTYLVKALYNGTDNRIFPPV